MKEKKVWVKNVDTNVKYEIDEAWYLNNTRQFELTTAPVADEVTEKPAEKKKTVKKAKVSKKVLKKVKTEDKE